MLQGIFRRKSLNALLTTAEEGHGFGTLKRSLGAFQLTLGRDVPVQMIRVGLPQGTDLYPEISGSHYRCSVRFLIWQDAATRAVQTTEDVAFTLSTCT